MLIHAAITGFVSDETYFLVHVNCVLAGDDIRDGGSLLLGVFALGLRLRLIVHHLDGLYGCRGMVGVKRETIAVRFRL